MNQKIFWDKQTGTVYWLHAGTVAFAPMNNDDTCDLGSGGIVEVWENPEDKERIINKLT